MSLIDTLDERIDYLKVALEDYMLDDPDFDMDEFQETVCDMEMELLDCGALSEEEQRKVREAQRLIVQVKDEYDFFDADAERSAMFPNGEDDY